jgi:hypothetical protein
MNERSAYMWAATGVAVPAIILFDLNFLGDRLISYPLLILAVWPSSFILSGSHGWNSTMVIGLLISVAINAALYLGVGFSLSKALVLITGSHRLH